MALSAGLSKSEPLTAPSVCHITVQLLSPQQSWFCQAIWIDPLFQGLSFQMFSKDRFSVSVCWNTVWTVWVWRVHLVCPDTGLLLPHTSSRTMVLLRGVERNTAKVLSCWQKILCTLPHQSGQSDNAAGLLFSHTCQSMHEAMWWACFKN